MYLEFFGIGFHLPAKLAPIPLSLVNYALLIFTTYISQFFSHRSLEKTFAALATIHTYFPKNIYYHGNAWLTIYEIFYVPYKVVN